MERGGTEGVETGREVGETGTEGGEWRDRVMRAGIDDGEGNGRWRDVDRGWSEGGHRVERGEIKGGRRFEVAVGRWKEEELANDGLEGGKSINGGYREATGQREGNVCILFI